MTATRKRSRLVAAASVSLLAISCARPQAAPVRFVDSEPFAKLGASIYGILEADLNGDGLPDAIAARQVGPGYSASVFHQLPGSEKTTWRSFCVAPVVRGGELGLFRFVEVGGSLQLFMVAVSETPDEQTQSLLLVDPRDDCTPRFSERLRLPKPAEIVIAPGSVPAGVQVERDGRAIRIIDKPELLELESANGDAQLLMAARVRVLSSANGAKGVIETSEKRLTFLRPRTLRVTSPVDGGEPTALDELTDGQDQTSTVLRPGEAAQIIAMAEAPMVLLEIHHGCHGEQPKPLELSTREGASFVTGSSLPAGSFAIAAGRSHSDSEGVRLELLALESPTATMSLLIAATDTERCLREIRAYGFPVAP